MSASPALRLGERHALKGCPLSKREPEGMTSKVAAVIVAAGRGHRAGREMPKQYRHIGGEPVIRAVLAAFAGHPRIDAVQPVIHADDEAQFRAATAGLAR
jgi:2-C-methyl-D-erythritol 4-phosphate cytidylyltransferase